MKNYMNPNTGSVDSLDGWDMTEEEAKAEGLIEVIMTEAGWAEA